MKRKVYLDYLNVLSAFAVVMLHTNNVFWTFSYNRYWLSANIIESVFYFAVPIFFMISGATLIDYSKRYSTKTFLKKRFSKTLIPFLFWSILALVYLLHYHKIDITNFSLITLLDLILNSKLFPIYWFFMPLFGLYLSMPLLSAVDDEKKKSIFKYIIVSVFLLSVLQLICGIIKLPYFNLNVASASGYVIYLLIGYYVSHYELSDKSRHIIYVLGFIALLVHLLGVWKTSYMLGAVDKTFKGYLSPMSILYASALFVFFRYASFDKMKGLNKIINFLRETTFGIYLIHYFIIYHLCYIIQINRYSIVFRTLGAIAIFLTVALIVKLLKRIPVIKQLV